MSPKTLLHEVRSDTKEDGDVMGAGNNDFMEASPAQTWPTVGTSLIPTAIFDDAADYAFSVCGARAFEHGSKAARLISARMFLGMKGRSLADTNTALSATFLAVAAGAEDAPALAAALERRFKDADAAKGVSESQTTRS
jgi:prophage maintenance system killer protein